MGGVRLLLALLVLSGGVLSLCGRGGLEARAQSGIWIVTPSEAALPLSRASNTGRCVTRGPAIRQISPVNTVTPNQPFRLKIEFAARTGEKIDPASVQIAMLRGDTIDMTQRLQPYISAHGIDIPNAMVPSGTHVLQITVSDAGCHKSAANIEIEAR